MPDTVKQKDKPSRAVSIVFWVVWGIGLLFLLAIIADAYDACKNPGFPIPAEIGWGYNSTENYIATSVAIVLVIIGVLILSLIFKKNTALSIILIILLFISFKISNDPYGSPVWVYPLGKLIHPLIPELGGTLCLTR